MIHDYSKERTYLSLSNYIGVEGHFFVKRDFNIFSIKAPNFLCLPDLVKGIPIRLEIRDLNAEIPKNLLQEKPPRFISKRVPKC